MTALRVPQVSNREEAVARSGPVTLPSAQNTNPGGGSGPSRADVSESHPASLCRDQHPHSWSAIPAGDARPRTGIHALRGAKLPVRRSCEALGSVGLLPFWICRLWMGWCTAHGNARVRDFVSGQAASGVAVRAWRFPRDQARTGFRIRCQVSAPSMISRSPRPASRGRPAAAQPPATRAAQVAQRAREAVPVVSWSYQAWDAT